MPARFMVINAHPGLNLQAFDCREEAQNAWFRNRALSNQVSGDAQTYVIMLDDDVIGFYAVMVSSVVRSVLPTAALRRNAPDPVSCVLLEQLAVDRRWQRQGVSERLMLHAMEQAARVAELTGCRLFAVNPLRDELLPYYRKFGFVLALAKPALRVMSMRSVRATLAAVSDA